MPSTIDLSLRPFFMTGREHIDPHGNMQRQIGLISLLRVEPGRAKLVIQKGGQDE